MSVAILGSLNLDVVFSCKTLPAAGETILCSTVVSGPGGKGLNQAVAARRAGCDVRLIGAVGDDPNGDSLLSFLAKEGINTDSIVRLEGVSTGLAHIVVDQTGENSIVVASGANKAIKEEASAIDHVVAPVFLTQLEVELGAVAAFLSQGRRKGARTILNAAPAIMEASAVFEQVDIVIVNENELAQFSSAQCQNGEESLVTWAARKIISRADQTIVVTLGALGTQIVDSNTSLRIPARAVKAIDTTGAGDCFCGVLAAGIAGGLPMVDAVRRANMAASLAVQRAGAAVAMPEETEIDRA